MTTRLYPDMVQDVLDFYAKFNPTHVEPLPTWPRFDRMRLAYTMVKEESIELDNAVANDSLEEIADAIGDSIYVLLGMAAAMGIDMRPVWVAIHRANMAKEGGASRADGKILKPEGWTPPDLKTLLDLQNPIIPPGKLALNEAEEPVTTDA